MTQTYKEYSEKAISELLDTNGAFFAFSEEQFNKAKVEGVKYVNAGAGLVCPKENAEAIGQGFKDITAETMRLDLEQNGKKEIIRRELENYECYYTGDAEDAIDALRHYPITADEIIAELF